MPMMQGPVAALFSMSSLSHRCYVGLARGPPQFLRKRSENAGANENLSCGLPSIPGVAPGVAPRIVVFILLKSWDVIL